MVSEVLIHCAAMVTVYQSACVVNCAIESERPDDTPLEVPEDGLAEGALPRSEEDEPLGAEAPVPLVVSLPDVPVLLPLTPVEPPVPVVPDVPAPDVPAPDVPAPAAPD